MQCLPQSILSRLTTTSPDQGRNVTPLEAQAILEDLAAGKDPTTGRLLPTVGPLHTPYVLQALNLGAMALARSPSQPKLNSAGTAPRTQRKRPVDPDASRSGRWWTSAEDGRLVAAYDAGVSIVDLAKRHGRTRFAIAGRLVDEGRDGKLSEVFGRANDESDNFDSDELSPGELPI